MERKTEKLPGEYYFVSGTLPLAVRRVEGARISHDHDYTAKPHLHNFSELVVITAGKGEQMINGFLYPVSAGDVFMMQDRTEHCFTDYEDLKITNIMFAPELYASQLAFLHRIPGYNVIFRIEPAIRGGQSFENVLHLSMSQQTHVSELIDRMEQELSAKTSGYEAAAVGILLELIVYLSRGYRESETDRRAALRLGRFLSQLEKSFIKPWSLGDMAHNAAMSVNHFLRTFKAATGETPMNYLTRRRLKLACRLLRETALSISEIAFRCGFNDSNYFSKRFLAEFGCTPRAFRKKES